MMVGKKRKNSFAGMILYFALIPIAITFLLTFTLMSFLGYEFQQSVLKAGQQIPFVSVILPKPDVENVEVLKAKLHKKELELLAIQEQLTKLEQKLIEKDAEKASIQKEKEALQAQLAEKQMSEQERKNKLKAIAKLYESMTTSRAATVLEEMEIDQVAIILNYMNSKSKANLYGKFRSQFAADLTTYELEAIQYETMSVPIDMLDVIFTSVSIEEAGSIFANMSHEKRDFNIAVSYLEQLETERRDAFLAVLEEDIAATYKEALTP
jgi:flagellar motility protein MotE (MotC chaperone)